jgi:hypothetical protein
VAQMILIDQQSGLEIGRRPMDASERYALYRNHMEHETLLFGGKYYTTHEVKWKVPQEDFVACVSFHSNEMVYCDC